MHMLPISSSGPARGKKRKSAFRSSAKGETITLRLSPEIKAALKAYADIAYDGNLSDAMRAIALATIHDKRALLHQEKIIALTVTLDRLCQFHRDGEGSRAFTELRQEIALIEAFRDDFKRFAER